MSMPEQLEMLGQYGLVGVMLALIGALVTVCWINYKISGNHINHNTDAINRLENAITKLVTLIDAKLK